MRWRTAHHAEGHALTATLRVALAGCCVVLCLVSTGARGGQTPARASHGCPVTASRVVICVERSRHGAADRVVLWMPRGAVFAARPDGGDLVLDLPEAAHLVMASRVNASRADASREDASQEDGAQADGGQRLARGITAVAGLARLHLAPGATPVVHQLADRVVIDVTGPAAPAALAAVRPEVAEHDLAAPTALPRIERPSLVMGQVQVSLPPPLPAAPNVAAPRDVVAPPGVVAPPPVPRPAASGPALRAPPPGAAASPQEPGIGAESPDVLAAQLSPAAGSAISVSLLPPDPARDGPSILLPMNRMAAAAAFVRGGELRVVLDLPRLLDLSQLKDDPLFGGASETLLPDGTELRLRPPPGTFPQLTRHDAGWVLTLSPTALACRPIGGHAQNGMLRLAAAVPGHVVSVEDALTGLHLLVGTQRASGQCMPAGHQSSEWALLPTLQGVLVQPVTDRLMLHDIDTGFELRAGAPPALSLVWPEGPSALDAAGNALTRRFDFPALPVPVLQQRLAEALRDAALAPHAERAVPRLHVAQAMLALGLDAEAASVLQAAAADDPSLLRNPDMEGLSAIAAFLFAQAGGAAPPQPAFDTAQLGGSDEAGFWRALWSSGAADAAAPAASLANRWRLLLDYPEPLRNCVLAAVADVLGRGGQDAALAQLLAAFDGPALGLANARLLRRQGKAAESLALLDRLSTGRDRLARARALEEAVEQRLADHEITPKEAADKLDHQLYAWRGGERELRLRLRVAELRAQAGAWRAALSELRETDEQFPDAHDRIHATEISLVSGLLKGNRAATLSALDLVALADDASTLLGADDADAALAPLLADRLLALDLPARAEPILRRLLDRAGDGPAKAGLGMRLAGLIADRGDGAGALAVLDASEPAGETASPIDRTVLRARLLAELGRPRAALERLAGVQAPQAAELAATIQEGGKDWAGAEKALSDFIRTGAFAGLPAPAQHEVVLRAVRDAAEAGDMAGLRQLRDTFGNAFKSGSQAELFAVLTADPVREVADLRRSARELGAIRTLPAALSVANAR